MHLGSFVFEVLNGLIEILVSSIFLNLISEITLKFEVSPFPQCCYNQDKIFQGYADLPLFLSTLGFCVSS